MADWFDDLLTYISEDNKDGILSVLQRLPNIPDALDRLRQECGPLILASCQKGYSDILQFLIDNGIDVSDTGTKKSPVQLACEFNHVGVLDLLLKNDVPILPSNVKVWEEESPLYIATRCGNLDCIQRLVEKDPSLIKDDKVRNCLLYAACLGGHINAVKLWFSPGIDINHPLQLVKRLTDCEKLTPLYAACSGGHKHIIEFLHSNCEDLQFTASVCQACPDVIGQFLQKYFLAEKSESEDDFIELYMGNLQHKKLHMLHPDWFTQTSYFMTLAELDISQNSLTELPDCLPWRFQNLRSLDVSRNSIRFLNYSHEENADDSICPRLEMVNFSYNNLESVCRELFEIFELRHLDLSHNKLIYLTKSLRHQGNALEDSISTLNRHSLVKDRQWLCLNLRKLDVSHNALEMLPIEIQACKDLVNIVASNNRLSTFPQPWNCPLENLDLSHNQLERFPVNTEMYWSGTLRYLNISHNNLDEINEGIVRLGVLTDLIASNNKIDRLPSPEVWECGHLHNLNLKHNRLGIPVDTPTKKITLPFPRRRTSSSESDKRKLQFPVSLSYCLKELRLCNNNLDCVPESVCELTSLEVLDLSDNPLIKVLPRELGKLKNCGMLKLKNVNVPVSSNKTKEILSELLENLRDCQPYNKIKAVVLGKKDKGKTTLVNILANKKTQSIVNRKSIVREEVTLTKKGFSLKKELDIKLNVWDISGDEIYTQIHHSVFTPFTLYILVWDFWSITEELDKIEKWINNIQASTSSYCVVLVGTFIDKLTSLKEDTVQIVIDRLKKKFGDQAPKLCPVSCINMEGIEGLKTCLYETALSMTLPGRQRLPLIGRKVPKSYKLMEKLIVEEQQKLQEEKKPLCLTQNQFLDIIESLPAKHNDLQSAEETVAVTKFLEDTGYLLHFSDQLGALDTLYFLDPAWLCDILVHVLISPKGKKLLKQGRGRISRRDAEMIYKESEQFPSFFVNQYLELLERFEIAASISQSEFLFFPCQLPIEPPIIETADEKSGADTLRRLFRMSECPSGFWMRLVTRMMMRVEQFAKKDWHFRPILTHSMRMMSMRHGGSLSKEPKRGSHFHGLQIKNARKTFCRELIHVSHEDGSFCVEPASFTGSDSRDSLQNGILITEVSKTGKFGIIGIIADEIEDIIQDFYPGLLEPDMMTLTYHLERYALCSTCYQGLPLPNIVNHFTMEHCARLLVIGSTITCPKGIKQELNHLVPDLLMKELPDKYFMDLGKLELTETKENCLGTGVAGSVFRGKYNGQAVAIKVYRSDIRNKAADGRFTSLNSSSSDSGTATLSTEGSLDSLKKKKTTLKAFKEDIDWALAEVLNANQQSEESCSDDTNDTNVDDIEMQGSRTIGCDDGGQELQDNKSVYDNNCDSEQKDNSDDGCTNTFVVESCSGDYDMNDCDMEIQSNNFSGNIEHQGYKSVENDNGEIKQNEESCSDDSNDGNDDDIEIQDNTFVDRNDGDMEIQENKSVNDNDGDIEIQDNKSVNDNDGDLKIHNKFINGNDDDIEIQNNKSVNDNDGDIEILNNKSVNDNDGDLKIHNKFINNNDGDIEIQNNKSVNDNDGDLKIHNKFINGNDDDIEIQDNTFVDRNDGDMEIQNNKSVNDFKVDMEIYINKSADRNDSDIEIHDKYVTSNDSEIKQNEESCSDDSNDGNDDDIEIQDNKFVDGNDGDMEIQENKSVDSDNGESDFSYDDDKDEDYVLPSDIDSDEEFCPAPDMSKYLKKHVETKILFENVNESADCLDCCSVPDIQKKTAAAKNMYKRVTESADSLDSNCYVQGIGNDATVLLENVSDLELKRLDEDKIIRDVNLRKIYMRKHMKLSGKQSQQMRKKTTERIYNNYHCCFYCSRFVQHISTHMKTHRNIDAVRNIMKMTNPDFSTIRKLGDDKNNQKVVEMKEGEFLIARRPTNNYLDVQQYGPCPHCREWLQLNGLKKHIHQCLKGSSEDEIKESVGNCVLKSQVMAGFISSKTSKVMREEVLPAMKRDTVRHVVINDKLILMLGESWLRRNVDNVEKRKYYASQHMRLVAKMLLELRKMKEYEEGNVTEQNNDDTETALWEFLKPGCFDKIVDASLQVSLPDMDDMSELKAPSNAIKLKYDLKRLVNMKYAFLMKTNQEGREVSDCKSFLELMNLEWSERVTKIARTILQKRKYIESKDLPSPDDIEKLTKYLVSQLESMELIPDNYMKINALCQTRLMMYNKRRSGELEVISLQSYAARRKDLSDIDESVAADLTKVETYLLKSQELMTVRGKGGRPVPVIVPQDVKGPLDFIASKMTRKAAGISESNKYLFPNTALKYIRAYDSLKIACDSCQLKSPQRITSVAMRKYTATLSQLMNLDKYQMDWLCRHLGHTKPVHREAYRQMSGLIERVYVTKLMMVQDLNLTGQFKGQSLEDIDLKAQEEEIYVNIDKATRSEIDLDEAESMKALRAIKEMRQEVALTSRLHHPCIISLVGLAFSPKLMMALELAPLGSLRNILDKQTQGRPVFNRYKNKDELFPPLFEKELVFKFVYQIAKGLEYLHANAIIYKDLKSDNILAMSLDLSAPVNLKLSDYGISKYNWSGRSVGMVGTPGYQAPEILDGKAYDEKVDIFALAMVIYEILTGRRPYAECDNLAQISKAMKLEGRRPNLKDFNVMTRFPSLEKMMRECWNGTGLSRPAAGEMVSKHRMQNVQFLAQTWPVEMPDNLKLGAHCELGSYEIDNRSLLCIWDGYKAERNFSILDPDWMTFRVAGQKYEGPQVVCMAQVGRHIWVGNQENSIVVYKRSETGSLEEEDSFDLDSCPVQILAVQDQKGRGSAVCHSIYVALVQGSVLQFQSAVKSKGRAEGSARTVRKIHGYTGPAECLLRSRTIYCMEYAETKHDLWVSGSGHLDIVHCPDFKVDREVRINLTILLGMCQIYSGLCIGQMACSGSQMFCMLAYSPYVIEFDVDTYMCKSVLNLDAQNVIRKIVSKTFTETDHDAYHGNTTEDYCMDRDGSSNTNNSDESSDNSSSDEEQSESTDFDQTANFWTKQDKETSQTVQLRRRQSNEAENTSNQDAEPPMVPPRPSRKALRVLGIRGDSVTRSCVESPIVPPRPPRPTTDFQGARSLRPSNHRRAPPIPPHSNTHNFPRRQEKPKVAKQMSYSLPNMPTNKGYLTELTSILIVKNSLWVGRRSGDICVINIHRSDSGDLDRFGKVVADMYDINSRNREGKTVENVRLIKTGKHIASAYTLNAGSESEVQIAFWESYGVEDVERVGKYWDHILAVEKDLLNESKEVNQANVEDIGNF